MTNLGIVFLTGLTTGGLSCLAVQGGLLARSIAPHMDHDRPIVPVAPVPGTVRQESKRRRKQRTVHRTQTTVQRRSTRHLTRPIVVFLAAKVSASTLLGALLGWVGAMLQLTPFMRALLQFGIGIVLLSTALQMFNVHPIFRILVLEPPAMVRRYLRRAAKDGSRTFLTPLSLGALTVLIPCGVTQAMMILAIGTGNALAGAAIMLAFTLGTSPVFFTLAYMATRLGDRMQTHFRTVTAVMMVVMGLLSVEGGLNLVGSPYSFASLRDSLQSPSVAQAQPVLDARANMGSTRQMVTIQVGDSSYTPTRIQATAGQPLQLRLVTNNTTGCTRAFVIPALNLQRILPATGTTVLDLPAQPAGTMQFTCSMGMYRGRIQFD